jgi:hypothetical protein
MKKPAESPKRKPYRDRCRFGILNRVGDIWTSETFQTEAAAQAYLDRQRANYPTWKLGRHKIAPVYVTVRIAPAALGE